MALDREALYLRVLEAVGQQAKARALPLIPSSTLRAALLLIVDESIGRGELFIPHYWAVYVQDGHAAFGPKGARFLVFFDDPDDDPRKPNPERFANQRRLKRAEFQEGLERNAERRARGQRPFMFVVRRVGATQPTGFFEPGLDNLSVQVGPTIVGIFDEAVQAAIDGGDFPTDEDTARFRLG